MAGNPISKELPNEILKVHNEYRAQHGSPGLKISEKLNKLAQEWAENLAKKDKAEHRPKNPHGENIYMARNTDPNWILKGDTVVKAWYDEIKSYKFGEASPKNSSEVGHFTQLIWKDTAELGIGIAMSKSGKVYVVCNYDPPGNVILDFGKNVLPSSTTTKLYENESPRFIDEVSRYDREILVLAPEQENIDVQCVEPNTDVVESMERLYAIPSEKIRVWSVWLTKIEEKASEWNTWLRSHLNLILRMSEQLQRAENEIAPKERMETMESNDEKQYRQDVEIDVEKASMTANAGKKFKRKFKKSSEETELSSNEKEDDTSIKGRKSTKKTNEKEIKKNKVANSVVAEEKFNEVETMAEATTTTKLENETSKEINEYTEDKNEEENVNVISGNGHEETNEDETEGSKKIAWPIGVPWEPVVQHKATKDRDEETEVSKKKDEEFKVIAIPENEEDMQELIRNVKEQATIFRSLYKHWLEVGDKAVKEVVDRKVKDAEEIDSDDEIPYSFYVNAEADIEIGVEHDDEKVLLPDFTREKIISDFKSLYFNLADKPGKS